MIIMRSLYFAVIVVFIVNNTASAMEGAATTAVAAPTLGEPGVTKEDAWIPGAIKLFFRQPEFIKPEKSIDINFFNSCSKPKIILEAYFDRIFKYMRISPSCFVVALIYINRLAVRVKGFVLTDYNVHRIFFVAIWIAHKVVEDEFYAVSHGAQVAGIPVEELNNLELRFLDLIDFDLFVSCDQYCSCEQVLRNFTSVASSSDASVQMSTVVVLPQHNIWAFLSDVLGKCTLL